MDCNRSIALLTEPFHKGSVASVEAEKNVIDFSAKEESMLLKISKDLLPKFKCFCSSPELIMMFVYMKCRFSLSYRDLE